MRCLVVGASGQVGSNLLQVLREAGHSVTGTYHLNPLPGLLPLDIRDAAGVRQIVTSTASEIVYLPASLTNVDYCENHPEESFSQNVTGVRNVVAAGAPVAYFSSDYVFSGQSGPYSETDPMEPLSVYGRHKVLAEESLPPNALCIRTTVVYGREWQGKNFIDRLVRTLRERRVMVLPEDQVGMPTYALDLARAAVHLASLGASGIYHVAGPERVSRYEFGREAAMVFDLDPNLIRPVATVDLSQAARRPLDAGLISAKAQALLPFDLMGYRAGLREFRRVANGKRVA